MKHISYKHWAIPLFILTPLLVSLACQPFQPHAPSTTTPAPENSTIEEGRTFEAELTFGSGPVNFPDTKAGLADLSSYKSTLTLSFDGTNAGQPQKWSKTYVMLTTQEPAARQLAIEKTGDLSNLDPVFMAEMDGVDYERRGENSCSAEASVEGNSLAERMEPAGFLGGVIGAEEAGSETVNDVAASHYTFNERALGELSLAKSTGEMWVASDGGYVLKYLLITTGAADYFGEGIEGTLTWDYELTDVNQPLAITLPDDCPAGMVDAPLLPDATDVVRMPGLLTFGTVTSLTDAAAFYQEQLPGLGWTQAEEPAITNTSVLLDFSQDSKTLTVIIAIDDIGVTTVYIVNGTVQE